MKTKRGIIPFKYSNSNMFSDILMSSLLLTLLIIIFEIIIKYLKINLFDYHKCLPELFI